MSPKRPNPKAAGHMSQKSDMWPHIKKKCRWSLCKRNAIPICHNLPLPIGVQKLPFKNIAAGGAGGRDERARRAVEAAASAI